MGNELDRAIEDCIAAVGCVLVAALAVDVLVDFVMWVAA